MSGSAPEWLGLLKWSLQTGDGTEASSARPISEQDKEWLDDVMRNLVRNDVQVMVSSVEKMYQFTGRHLATEGGGGDDEEKGEEEREEVTEAELLAQLEHLQDVVEMVDMSTNFAKMGGLEALLFTLFEKPLSDALWQALCIVYTTLVQNNPPVQQQAVDELHLQRFLSAFLEGTLSAPQKAYLLSCIGSIVRGSESATFSFLEQGGLALIKDGLYTCTVQNDSRKLLRKVTFLAKSLVQDVLSKASVSPCFPLLVQHSDSLVEIAALATDILLQGYLYLTGQDKVEVWDGGELQAQIVFAMPSLWGEMHGSREGDWEHQDLREQLGQFLLVLLSASALVSSVEGLRLGEEARQAIVASFLPALQTMDDGVRGTEEEGMYDTEMNNLIQLITL